MSLILADSFAVFSIALCKGNVPMYTQNLELAGRNVILSERNAESFAKYDYTENAHTQMCG
jgi:hypothetical protein